jgi:hypothetical protein
VTFVIDQSASVSPAAQKEARDFVAATVRHQQTGDAVSLFCPRGAGLAGARRSCGRRGVAGIANARRLISSALSISRAPFFRRTKHVGSFCSVMATTPLLARDPPRSGSPRRALNSSPCRCTTPRRRRCLSSAWRFRVA